MDLFQHASDANQVMAEDLSGGVEQFEDGFIVYRVVDVGALFTRDNNIPVTQHRELLRSVSRLDSETLADLINSQLALTQCVEDRDSQGMGQCLEEFRFEIAELLSHPASPFIPKFLCPFSLNTRVNQSTDTIREKYVHLLRLDERDYLTQAVGRMID
jgi:hypothetical protein